MQKLPRDAAREVSSQEGPEAGRRRSPRVPYSEDTVTCNARVIGDVPSAIVLKRRAARRRRQLLHRPADLTTTRGTC
jgi:hypothetical protein